MNPLTLLERISDIAQPKHSTEPVLTDTEKLERSLRRNLTSILNTNKGSVPIAPEYGISDITDLGHSFSEESIQEFIDELERVILQYEPRLLSATITYTPRSDKPLDAVFTLEGTLKKEFGMQVLRFETELNASGQVKINT